MAYFIAKQAAAKAQADIRQALLDSCRYISSCAPSQTLTGDPITIGDYELITIQISGHQLNLLREAIAQAIKNPEASR